MDMETLLPLGALLTAAGLAPLALGSVLIARRPRTALPFVLGIVLGVALYFAAGGALALYGALRLPVLELDVYAPLDAYLNDLAAALGAALTVAIAVSVVMHIFWRRFMVVSDGLAFGAGLFGTLAVTFCALTPLSGLLRTGSVSPSGESMYLTGLLLALSLPIALGLAVMLEKQAAFRRVRCWFGALGIGWGLGVLMMCGRRLELEAPVIIGALFMTALAMCVYILRARPELALDEAGEPEEPEADDGRQEPEAFGEAEKAGGQEVSFDPPGEAAQVLPGETFREEGGAFSSPRDQTGI